MNQENLENSLARIEKVPQQGDTELAVRALRLRSTSFDPRALVAGVTDPMEACRSFIARVLDASDAIALPDAGAARGRPFRVFEDLASYQREVLRVSCGARARAIAPERPLWHPRRASRS